MTHSEYVIKIAEIENRQKARKRAKEEYQRNTSRTYQARLAAAKADYDHQLNSYNDRYRSEQDADEQLKLATKIEYIKSREEEDGGGAY